MKKWNSNRAVLLVHGIGGGEDYHQLQAQMRIVLGSEADNVAFYGYSYNEYNQWFAEKAQVARQLKSALAECFLSNVAEGAGDAASEYLLDVLWPIFVQDARKTIQAGYLRKLQEMVLEGRESGVNPRDQKITIVCHSLGCFHTYEILHHCLADSAQGLTLATHGVHFENVIFMASPVQLIRTLGSKWMSNGLYCLQPEHLKGPTQPRRGGNGKMMEASFVDRWVSITGDLDPVGGHFLGKKCDWAYMDVAPNGPFSGQESIVDDQGFFNVRTVKEWKQLISEIGQKKAEGLEVKDPHSWSDYIDRHQADLKRWMLA